MKIALLVPNYRTSGGVKTVANFISYNIRKNKNIETDIISIKSGYNEKLSKNIVRPASWLKGVRTHIDTNGVTKIIEVGTNWSELEFQRYKPTYLLTELLDKYDIIQVVSGTPAWALLTKNSKTPTVLQVATLTKVEREELLKSNNSIRILWYRFMTEVISAFDYKGLQIADAIMVENYWMQERLESLGFGNKTVFAPPGVDTSIYKPTNNSSTRIVSEPYLLNVGRLDDPRKDVITLFKAYAHLKKVSNYVPKLVLAGKKLPGKVQMDFANRLKISGDIHCLENVSLEDLINIYQNAEVFILSSREEGLGMVIMEAMACGIPVVATDCGGPATLITNGRNGFLVDVGDSVMMANRIKMLLQKPELRKMFIDNSLKSVKDKFEAKKSIQKFVNVYKSLL